MPTSTDYRRLAVEQRALLARIRCLAGSAEYRQRAEAFEALASTEDWLNGVVSPMEHRAMPVYSLDMQQRFARISKQRFEDARKSENARKAKVIPFSPRLERANRANRRSTTASSAFKPSAPLPVR